MSKAGVRYNLATNEILGLYQVALDADLTLNFNAESEGMLEVPASHLIFTAQLRWRVLDRALTEKAIVTFTADKARFQADGLEQVAITITGLMASALADLGGGLTVAVSPADPVIRITCDIPRNFSIRVMDANHWSKPVEIEAV